MALNMTVTDTGWAKMLSAEAQGLTLSLSEIGLGSQKHLIDPALNALGAEEERVAIGAGSVDLENRLLRLNRVLESATAYEINELGLFDTAGDLIFVWAAAPGGQALTAKTAQTKLALGFGLVLAQAPVEIIQIIDEGQPLELMVPDCGLSTAALAAEALRAGVIQIETRFAKIEETPLNG